jgi:hypothetical protein
MVKILHKFKFQSIAFVAQVSYLLPVLYIDIVRIKIRPAVS